MHSPLRMHAAAHFRDASGPSPVRTISIIPLMISPASAIPAGATLGQTSTHLPHRVQASSMSSTRAPSAVSKDISLIGLHPLANAKDQTTHGLGIGSGNLVLARRGVNGKARTGQFAKGPIWLKSIVLCNRRPPV